MLIDDDETSSLLVVVLSQTIKRLANRIRRTCLASLYLKEAKYLVLAQERKNFKGMVKIITKNNQDDLLVNSNKLTKWNFKVTKNILLLSEGWQSLSYRSPISCWKLHLWRLGVWSSGKVFIVSGVRDLRLKFHGGQMRYCVLILPTNLSC